MTNQPHPTPSIIDPLGAAGGALLERLDEAFEQRFAVIDASRAVLERVSPDWPRADAFRWISRCETVARRGQPEILEDFGPLLLLAAPIAPPGASADRAAITVLLKEPVSSPSDLQAAARAFGLDADEAFAWARDRTPWPPHAALRLAQAIVAAYNTEAAHREQRAQLSDVSAHLLATFDELDLLHRLTERLSLDRSTELLCEDAVSWLADVVPADCIVARWLGEDAPGLPGDATSALGPLTLVSGKPPVKIDEVDAFFERLGPEAARRALVLNRDRTSSPTWCYPAVRELVVAPIRVNRNGVGWIAAMNYRGRRAAGDPAPAGVFGSVEASLLSSVAAILGVHRGNRELFEEEQALFHGAVHAFSSALDAKDSYTRGHSDRVSRIAVLLAEEMGVDEEQLETLRLGGLLHDIGKIGIDDNVLRKPDVLTPSEFDHIKTHPELGERILSGVPQLAPILPVVRHHHEAWDGGGYPDGLAGEETPQLARIAAVADAIDAMRGDRPYRDGMPVERVEAILRDGAGGQWDPDVIDAYFAVRDAVQAIFDEGLTAADSEAPQAVGAV